MDTLGFPVGSEVKVSASNSGDLGSIPGLGRSPGEGNDNPLQYSCLENPMDWGAWWAAVHGVTKSQTRLSDFTYFTLLYWNWMFQLLENILLWKISYTKKKMIIRISYCPSPSLNSWPILFHLNFHPLPTTTGVFWRKSHDIKHFSCKWFSMYLYYRDLNKNNHNPEVTTQ